MQVIPKIKKNQIKDYFEQALSSEKKRFPLILHKKGDYLNKVFNFLIKGTYMHPHLHPGKEKTEKMSVVVGSFKLIYFDDYGNVIKNMVIDKEFQNYIEVPPFTWHTYIPLTDKVLVYETMNGTYEPSSWKRLANWAPKESDNNYEIYLKKLNKINLT